MIADDPEEIAALLSGLRSAAPDTAHATRVRSRCRTLLARRRRTAASASDARETLARRAVGTALVAGFCAVYFSAIVVQAVQALLTLAGLQ